MFDKAASPNFQRGLTLIELLIVMVIVAIIGAVAYPSYIEHVVKTKRTAATSMLLQVADRQQQFFMDNKAYTANLTNLGFAANPLVIADDGTRSESGDSDAVYSISLANVTQISYTATATPINYQADRDTKCGSLSLTEAGLRSASTGSEECW